jgi:hypothetical protein
MPPQTPKSGQRLVNLDLLTMPPIVAPTPLDRTPLEQTNPTMASLRDFILGAVGVNDALTPTSSNSTLAGAALNALLPVGMAMGGLKKVSQAAQPIKAYHGSPHDFEQFSLSKIGTGEGAQAYGHGLYFAENPSVAKDYRDSLSSPQLKLRGEPLPSPTGGKEFLKLSDDQVRDEAARDFLTRAHKNMQWPHTVDDVVEYAKGEARVTAHRGTDKAYWESVEKRIQELAPELSVHEGKMYEVGLKASPDDFLDWDKPLSQQSEKVRKALEPLGFKDDKASASVFDDALLAALEGTGPTTLPKHPVDPIGSDLYSKLPIPDRSPARVSELLKNAGIKGIRYLDQGSRQLPDIKFTKYDGYRVERPSYRTPIEDMGHAGKGYAYVTPSAAGDSFTAWHEVQAPGEVKDVNIGTFKTLDDAKRAIGEKFGRTSNYVVFDDAIIEIMKKYAIPFAAAASLLKAQQAKPGQDR